MAREVWISGILSDYSLSSKTGLRWKYPDKPWSAAQHEIEGPTDDGVERLKLYNSGFSLPERHIPEALAIWNPKSFARFGDIFATYQFVLRPALAEIFARFDLGEGGVTPMPVYQQDLQTPAPGEFFLLRLGARKNSFLPDLSNRADYRIRPSYKDPKTGETIWNIGSYIEDDDVVVSSVALEGADLWCETHVFDRLFLSGALAAALQQAKLKKVDFRLKRCRVAAG
jgi:hypothetical protein